MAQIYERCAGRIAKATESRADALEMKADALREQSKVLAFTLPGAENRDSSEELFEMFEQDALDFMRK